MRPYIGTLRCDTSSDELDLLAYSARAYRTLIIGNVNAGRACATLVEGVFYRIPSGQLDHPGAQKIPGKEQGLRMYNASLFTVIGLCGHVRSMLQDPCHMDTL